MDGDTGERLDVCGESLVRMRLTPEKLEKRVAGDEARPRRAEQGHHLAMAVDLDELTGCSP
jgi:hypothetical protein